MGEIKLPLFADMIFSLQNPNESTKHLVNLALIIKFIKITGFNVSIPTLNLFLYTSNEKLKNILSYV